MPDTFAQPAARLGRPLIQLHRVASTNDVAAELARQGASDGALVVADEQTAGRGRRGRSWVAPAGAALLCSLILRPPLPPGRAARLTMLAALGVHHAVAAWGLSPAIKWPNDVLVAGRKIAGILTETEIRGDRLEFAIVGIGVNLNVPADGLDALAPGATSMLAASGQPVQRESMLRLLLAEMEPRYAALALDGGDAVLAEWRAHLETLGRFVTVNTGGGVINGVAEDVDEHGALLLRQPGGALVAVTFGDVSG